jgi:hypothetical protein
MEIRRNGGRFYGFRVNCEQVPLLPASVVREVLDDPRMVPYFIVWKSRESDKVKQAVRLARSVPLAKPSEIESVEIKWPDGNALRVYLIWRRQPHGGTALLLRCTRCSRPQRQLYGAGVGDDGRVYVVRRTNWECRECAGLRYSSEGGALVMRGGPLSRLLRMHVPDMSSPRPEPWLPYVFASPMDAVAAGFAGVSELRKSI